MVSQQEHKIYCSKTSHVLAKRLSKVSVNVRVRVGDRAALEVLSMNGPI